MISLYPEVRSLDVVGSLGSLPGSHQPETRVSAETPGALEHSLVVCRIQVLVSIRIKTAPFTLACETGSICTLTE